MASVSLFRVCVCVSAWRHDVALAALEERSASQQRLLPGGCDRATNAGLLPPFLLERRQGIREGG